MRLFVAVLLTSAAPWSACAQSYTASVLAGGALPFNVLGTSALLGPGPQAVAVDGAGNVFLAARNAVWRLDAVTGILTVAAGNGTEGFSGDNGPATSAQVTGPLGVAVDSANNLYIADSYYNRIRKVSNGVITTVAGNGFPGFGGDSGPAVNASLSLPVSVAVDSTGSLYIADEGNNRIRKVTNGVITTVAGSGVQGFIGDNGPAISAQLDNPEGITLDSAGDLYIADAGNSVIRKVSGGVITTVAGNGIEGFSGDNGPATNAKLFGANAVAVDPAGGLYISDYNNYRVRKVAGGVITTVAGNGTQGFSGDNGPATSAELGITYGVAVNFAGVLYIVDLDNNRIRKVANGIITTVAGESAGFGDNGPSASAQFFSPEGVAADSAGNIYIADSGNNRVRKIANGVVTTFAGDGSCCVFSGDNGPAAMASVSYPTSLAVDSAGSLYINDWGHSRIRKVTNGVIVTVAGGGSAVEDDVLATTAQLDSLAGIAVDSAGNLYVAESDGYRVRKVSNGAITTVAGNGTAGFSGDNGPAASAQLDSPTGISVDSAGNLYIADFYNNRIRKVTNGVITTVAEVPYPSSVAVDYAGGVYITDAADTLVRKLSNGVISVVAGGGTESVGVGPATNADFGGPLNLAVDFAGNVYVVDTGNNRIYLLSASVTGLRVSSAHAGNFAQGQFGAAYTITVTNGASGNATIGPVTVTDEIPVGLTLVSLSGTGWACTINACTRADVLNPCASYPPIIATVNVAPNAPSQVTNQVMVSGGGEPNGSATDATTIGSQPTIVLIANAEGGSFTIAPNTWVEIKGLTLAPAGDARTWQASDFANGALPTQLDGVSVTVNGQPAYVYYISPTQVNILTPPNAVQGTVEVQLADNHTASAAVAVAAEPLSPSFFVFNGGPYVVAEHLNGSVIGPSGLYPGSSSPAAPGETVVLYANGFGPTSVPLVSGSPTQTGTLSPLPAITIGNFAATVLYAGLVAPGEYQFNVVIPASLSNGDQPITATYNNSRTQSGTLITIHQ